jgi:hypothetical protein
MFTISASPYLNEGDPQIRLYVSSGRPSQKTLSEIGYNHPMLTYTSLKDRVREFLAATGLTHEEFARLDLQEGSCDKTQQADIASQRHLFRFFPYDYFRFYFLHRHFCTILPDLML